MTTHIAVISDLHLPDTPTASQYACLDWTIRLLRDAAPDVVLAIGDLTRGAIMAAEHFLSRLERTGLPLLVTPGNSDLRGGEDVPAVRRVLSSADSFETDTAVILTVDSSTGKITESDRERIVNASASARGKTVVLATHFPLISLEPASQTWLRALLDAGTVNLFIAGHRHFDETSLIGKTDCHLIRGLDPDCAIGAPPAVVFFDIDAGTWTRRDVVWPDGSPKIFHDDQRERFLDRLGFSCMDDTRAGLAVAAQRHVPALELRAGDAMRVDPDELAAALARWRSVGGRYLSWHLPALGWDAVSETVTGSDTCVQSVAGAIRVGADRLVIHPPKASLAVMQAESTAWRQLSDAYRAALSPAVDNGVTVGVENMHMTRGETDSPGRRFGYTPDECLAWMMELRRHFGEEPIGITLDIGHARNNTPISKTVPLSVWYARLGQYIVGYHLHQVTQDSGGVLRNHQPLTEPYGPLISLSSLLWSWRTGQCNAAPMILEIRPLAGRYDSLSVIQAFIREAGSR